MFNKKKSDKNVLRTDSILDVLSDEIVIMFGELRKKGKVNTAWKSRWCELSFLAEGLTLSYYLSKFNKKLCGTIKTSDIFAIKAINYDEKEFEDYDLPKDIENDPTPDISNLKYSFALCTLSREFVLAAPNKTDYIGWIETFNKYIYGNIIYQGFLLLKKEKTTGTWKKRYFILNEYKQFKYYEEKDKKTFCGAISLSEVNDISNGKVYDDAHKFTFNLYSKKNKRKWVLCCKSMKERDKWLQKIKQIRANEQVAVIGQNDVLSDDDILSDRDIFSDIDVLSDTEGDTDVKMNDCESIESCKSLDNLCSALHFFSTIIDKSLTDENAMNLLLNYFENDGKSILNDYGHLLHLHLDNNKDNNNESFKVIYSKMSNLIDCELTKCRCYNRNTRKREKQKINDDTKISYYIDLVDTIHCYFLHSYHIGYKLQIDSKQNDEEYGYDEYTEMIDAIRDKNQPKPTSRFTTFIPKTVATEDILSVGHRFNYWDDEDEYFVPPKFATFKKEIIGKISIGGYNLSVFKAEQYLQSRWMRRIKITLEQILALMIYIDYDKFADNMKKSFIRGYTINHAGMKLAESNSSLIKRNSKYAHLAQHLSEVIDGFGDNPMDQKNSNNLSFYTSPTFGGISNISTVDLSKIRLFGITSTTSSIEVIISNNNGIIIELNNSITTADDDDNDSQWPSWQNTTYFKCNFFSSKGYENEIIFTNTYNPLSISVMKCIYNNNEWIGCKTYINALVIFKRMLRGMDLDELKKYKKKHFEVILKMLTDEDELPDLILDVLERVKENVYEIIIDFAMFDGVTNKSQRKKIEEYFMKQDMDNMLKYKELIKSFPNVQSITVKDTSKKAQKINISNMFIEEILNEIDNMNNTQEFEQFKEIIIVNPDIKCNLKQFNEKCLEKNWKVNNENHVQLAITRQYEDDYEEEDEYENEYQYDIQQNGSFYGDDEGENEIQNVSVDKDSNTYTSNTKDSKENNEEEEEDNEDNAERERRKQEEQKRKELEEQKRKKREERKKKRKIRRDSQLINDTKKDEVELMRDKIEKKLKNKEDQVLRDKNKRKPKKKSKKKYMKDEYYGSDESEEEKPKKKGNPKGKSKSKPNRKKYSDSDSDSDDSIQKPQKKSKKKDITKTKPSKSKQKKYSDSDTDESDEKPKKKDKKKDNKKAKPKQKVNSKKTNPKKKKYYDSDSDESEEKPRYKKNKSNRKKGNGLDKNGEKSVSKRNPKKKIKKNEEKKDGIDEKPNIRATTIKKRNSKLKLKAKRSSQKLDMKSVKSDEEDKNKGSKKKKKGKIKKSNSRKSLKDRNKKDDKPKMKRTKSKGKKKKTKRSKSKKKIEVTLDEEDEGSTDLSNSDGF